MVDRGILSQKKTMHLTLVITSADVDRFPKLFHCQIPGEILSSVG